MKAKNYPVKFTLSVLMLIVIVGMAYGTYEIFFKQEVTDHFIIEINAAAGLADRDITKIVNNYIPVGTSLVDAVKFLEVRGFEVYKTNSDDWHELKSDGKDRYLASKEEVKNIIILTTTSIILVSDGEKVLSIYGKVHLTGF
ncbi:hypothetical protein [Pseudomonas indica]|uniref:hypothetical protein n=1 Tax=Pseudomonas indica TaxID=137658 RepID=UPI0023F9262C|nr:hypothetical protein [Pseudomonas indica]MBU3057628.1 hypothetical protein [Pseudomonas indica]